jgi:hypothetical protein
MCEVKESGCKCPTPVIWEQIKSLTLLMERLEQTGDKYFELLLKTETILQQQQAAIIEQYIKNRLKESDKK